MIKIIIVSFVVHAYTKKEGKTKMEGTSPVLQLRYFLNIPGFLSVLALIFFSPGLDATVLLAGFVESGWYMYNVCVWVITAHPLIYNPGLLQAAIRAGVCSLLLV